MKRYLLILTSALVLFVGASAVLASVGNGIGPPPSAGNSAQAQDKA